MKKLCYLPLITLFILTLSACKKDQDTSTYPIDQDIILSDIPYGEDSKQRMDIYLPEGRNSSTKFVVLIHGGGWSGGDKGDFGFNEEAITALKAQFPGFALFNLNYRLVEGANNPYPAAENDIKSAMDFIYRNLPSYQISSDTYILGGSAGAHLAALYVLKNPSNRIKGCIAIAGPYDLVSMYDDSNDEARAYLEAFIGDSPENKPDLYYQASPINFITTNAPKFLLLYGTADELVPVSQATEFQLALENKGIPVTDFLYPGGHGIPPESLAEAFDYIKDFMK